MAETRRGIAQCGTELSGAPTRQFFAYQNRLMINESADQLILYDSTGTQNWTAYAGTYEPPTPSIFTVPNWRMRGVEANKNFYISTSLGIKKLDIITGPITQAGVPSALDGTGVLAGAGSGFLGSNEQCAYQIVFGYVDANGNLNLGAPSERILVVNATGGSDNVVLTFTVPQGLTTSYFYQIYRTAQTVFSATPSANVPPGAEPQLAGQFQLTAPQLAAFSVTVTDVTTDALLGAALYTNPSQQGALQPNTPPPFACDMCVFSQMMFYANCTTLQTLTFDLISVGAPNGVQNGDTVTVNSIVFTGQATQDNSIQQFAVVTAGTVASNIDATARNLIACINANAATTNVYAIYLSGYNDLPGLIELQAVSFSIVQFSVTSSRTSAFSPALPISSSNDVTPNGIYVSKVGQPESVPSVNLVFVGGGDQPIFRVLPLRDRVIILKSDGVFVITGSTPQTLSVTLLDQTIICLVPESAKLLNNSVYCLSNQGVVSVTESGITIQSRAIEEDILSQTISDVSLSTDTYAISYESEHLYILGFATKTYCYNWITNCWTKWLIIIGEGSGIVNPFDNTLYLNQAFSNFFYVYKERKTYTYSDYWDDSYAVTINSIDSTGLVLSVVASLPAAVVVGDGLQQDNIGTAIITNINGTIITVDLNNSTNPGIALGFTIGAATILVPIPTVLTYAPITGGFPHYMKSWTRTNFWFNSGNFPILNTYFTTDVTSTGQLNTLKMPTIGGFGYGPYGPLPYGGTYNLPQKVQTLIPTDQSQACWIMPTLEVSFPGSRLSCLGVTLTYDIISDVTG